MAIRIQQYNTGPRRIGIGGVDPGFNQPALRDVTGTEGRQVLGELLGAGEKIVQVAVREYVRSETARVSQSLTAMQKDLAAERDRYMVENQGQNAINAGQHFEQYAYETAQKYLQDGGFEGKFAQMFRQQAAGTALHFTEQGQAYGRQQKALWIDSNYKSSVQEKLNAISQDYNNPEFIEFQLHGFDELVDGMFPGMDNRARKLEFRQNAAGSIIAGYLSHDDIRGARGAFEQYKELLGDEVNAVEAKIRNAQKALEAEARQRQLEARVALSGRIADAEAAWKDGLEVDNPPSYNEIAAAYGKDADKVWKQLRGLERLSTDIRAVRNMSPAEQDALLAERKPEPGEGYAENRQIYSLLVQSIAQDRKQRQDDPSAYVAQVVPDVSAARQAMYEEMTPETVGAYVTARNAALEARGISTTDVPLLPERDAQQIAVRLQNSADPVAEIQQLSSVTGKYYQQLVKQLSTNEKLSDSFVLVAGGMSPDAGKKLIDASRDKDFPKKAENLLNLTGTAKTDFTNKVQERIEDFNRTFLAGANSKYPEMIKEGVTRLALQYKMLTGDSDDTCIEKAARKVVLDRYSIVGPHGREFRVPVRFDADAIERGSAFELLQIVSNSAELMEPLHAPWMGTAQSKNLYASEIRRQAQWVTNEDETGVILCVLGRPVRDKDGNLVTRTWEELFASGLENATQGDVIGSLGGGGY